MTRFPLALALVALLAACSGSPDGRSASAPSAEPQASSAPASPSPRPSTSPEASTTPEPAEREPAEEEPAEEQQDLTVRRARRIVADLSLPELAGQVIVAGYAGTSPPTAMVRRLHLGGVIVMSDNIAGTAALRDSNRTLRRAARRDGRSWPLFIGVDQEGGIVERVKGSATRFPSFMSAGAADEPAVTRRAAEASGAELAWLGFNVVFAPDADVTSGPDDPTIGSRSPGSRPRLVARQALAATEGYRRAGVLPVLKHFPGHGSVPADSHEELPVQTRTMPQLRRRDLVPFRTAARADVPAVMVGHIDVRAADPGIPATWSHELVTGLLRGRIGFDGLVVTDAMEMAAVAERAASGPAAVRALRAGNDVVLMPADPAAARAGIVRAVRSGRLSRARLEQAVVRQVATLLRTRSHRPPRRPGGSRSASYRLSAEAITVVDGPCRGRMVGEAVQATGPPGAVARFHAAARRAGLATGSGDSVALVGYGGSGTAADVVVALDTPYVLGESSARVSRIALYGDTRGAMRALVDVLLDRAQAPGRLPVPVPGVPRRGC